MNHNNRLLKQAKVTIFLLICLLLAACSYGGEAESSQPIAVYPKNTPIAVAPPLPERAVLVYRLFLELQVNNVKATAGRVEQLAYQHGGYLISTQTWFADGRQNTTMLIAVPTVNFEFLHAELRGLGKLISESKSGVLVDAYPRQHVPYSHVTVHLRSIEATIPIIEISNGWDPLHTFQNAFAVFLRIFGFLADIFIWLLVVVGPFALLFGLTFLIVRRFRKHKGTSIPE